MLSLEQRSLRCECLRQEVERRADASGVLQIVVGEQPKRRSRLRHRLLSETAKPWRRIAQVTREQGEAQPGERSIA